MEEWVMKCDKEKGKGRLDDDVWQRDFSLPHFITQSFFSFLVATLYQPVVLFLFLCYTSSPSLPFSFFFATLIMAKRKEKEDLVMKCGNEKGKGRLGDEVWQRERKRKTG
jgi:DNA polymerase IIIc chi subunit